MRSLSKALCHINVPKDIEEGGGFLWRHGHALQLVKTNPSAGVSPRGQNER